MNTPNRTRAEQIKDILMECREGGLDDAANRIMDLVDEAVRDAKADCEAGHLSDVFYIKGEKKGTLKGLEMAKQIALKEEVGAEAAYDYAGSIAQEIDAKAKELEDGK